MFTTRAIYCYRFQQKWPYLKSWHRSAWIQWLYCMNKADLLMCNVLLWPPFILQPTSARAPILMLTFWATMMLHIWKITQILYIVEKKYILPLAHVHMSYRCRNKDSCNLATSTESRACTAKPPSVMGLSRPKWWLNMVSGAYLKYLIPPIYVNWKVQNRSVLFNRIQNCEIFSEWWKCSHDAQQLQRRTGTARSSFVSMFHPRTLVKMNVFADLC